MRRTVSTFVGVALIGAWGLVAQGQQPPQPPPVPPGDAPSAPAPRPSPSTSATGQEVTLAGCIERSGTTFKLTDAKRGGAPSTSQPGTPSTSQPGAASAPQPAQPAVAIANEYTLVAGTGVNFSPHVNHQVEVTGRVTPATPTSGAGAGVSTSSTAPTLTVSAVKMVAANCE